MWACEIKDGEGLAERKFLKNIKNWFDSSGFSKEQAIAKRNIESL